VVRCQISDSEVTINGLCLNFEFFLPPGYRLLDRLIWFGSVSGIKWFKRDTVKFQCVCLFDSTKLFFLA
jgi:hypothetical protein